MAEQLLLKKQDQVIAVAIESIYGEGATMVGADAVLAQGLTVTMLDQETKARDNIVGFMGNQGSIATGQKITTKFGVEFAPQGTANTPPAWDKLLRMSGMARVVDANSVVYTPVGSGFESTEMLYRIKLLQQRMLGTRSKFVLNLDNESIPMLNFETVSLYSAPTVETALLAGVDQSAFKKPLGVKRSNCSVTFLGKAVNMSTLSVDLGIGLTMVRGTETEAAVIDSRSGSVSLSFRTTDQELVDAVNDATNSTEGELNYLLGTTPGKRLTVNVPNLQVTGASVSWDGEIANVDVTADIKPLLPNNDLIVAQT